MCTLPTQFSTPIEPPETKPLGVKPVAPPIPPSVTKPPPPPSTAGIGGGGSAAQQRKPATSMNKPSIQPKAGRISNLMKQFEKNKGQNGDSEGSSDGGPTSPRHSLGVPSSESPAVDKSPLSGRKLNRKESVEDLTKKFGGRTRSPSPDVGKPPLATKSPGTVNSYSLLHRCVTD